MKFHDWRVICGLSKSAAARALGVHASQVLRIERGAVPSPDLIVTIYVMTGSLVCPNDFYDLPLDVPRGDSVYTADMQISLKGATMDLVQIENMVEERRNLQRRIDQITNDLKAVRELIDLRSTTGRPVKPRKKRSDAKSNGSDGGVAGSDVPASELPTDIGPGDTVSAAAA